MRRLVDQLAPDGRRDPRVLLHRLGPYVERVLAREKHHQIKDKTPLEAHRWLQHSRWRLGQVVSGLGKYGEVPVLCFDTSKQSIQEIVETVLGETGLPDASRRSDREAA